MRDEIYVRDLSLPSENFEAFYDVEPEVETDFSSQEEALQRKEKQRMQTRQKHVPTTVCQIEEIDSQTSCDTRPIIMAAFGTSNVANPTLIDSGADVNVMPYDIFNQLLVPTPGALSSFVGKNANCIGYADIEVQIK